MTIVAFIDSSIIVIVNVIIIIIIIESSEEALLPLPKSIQIWFCLLRQAHKQEHKTGSGLEDPQQVATLLKTYI